MLTTEMTLLLVLYVLVFGGLFFKDDSAIREGFSKGAPVLAGRTQENLSIGNKWTVGDSGTGVLWGVGKDLN